MNTVWKFRVITLIVALVGVLYAITSLQKGKAVGGLTEVGILPMSAANGAEQPKNSAANTDKADKKEKVIPVTHDEATKKEDKLSWCETRVKSLTTKSGIKIEQEGKDWFTLTPQKKAINSVSMEKWLGQYCTLQITDSRPPTFVPTKDVEMLAVGFINGETQKFTLTPEGFYFWDGLRFRSQHFKEAMDKLAKVANGETL
ncbi:MAG: hypothetical protein A4S09_04930 [Proteobacteria bacterium SG_bin7]|nr:MAG: hypothetical protein A4S09_04930 [Proteobacteria bacterium SG_bin7]